MDILKNFKSIFIVEDTDSSDNNNQASQNTQATEVAVNSEIHIDKKNFETSSFSKTAHVEERFLNVLYDAMSKHGKDGFDYLEYKQSLNSLSKLSMDEETRFKSAFAVAQTMGATPSFLIDAAKYYLDVLKNEEKVFEDTLKQQMQKQIGDKQNELQQIKNTIEDKQKQIERLTKEIAESQNSLSTLDQQISEASGKIESTKQNFLASYNQIADQINDDIQKMQQYLK